VRADGTVTGDTARAALEVFEVDERGLDRTDRAVLKALCVTFAGNPVGLGTLAIAVGEESDTVEDVYEPFLLKQGMLQRTPRGRIATAAAFEHLGLSTPLRDPKLFGNSAS
jgi:Holliday junction DNA helicase RuvB